MKAAAMRALITGASGGIGRSLAQELHGRGAGVLLVGRNSQALERAAQDLGGRSARVDWCAADLATVAGRARVVEAASLWGGSGINVLVNNAGCGDFGLLDEIDDAAIERLFAINAIAPMQLTRALLRTLRSQPMSAILNIGSVFGSLATPVSSYPPPSSRCAASPKRCDASWPIRRSVCTTSHLAQQRPA
jgi:short-subunit dehydrogenase